MIKKTLIFIGISFLFNLNSYSQIGIGTTNPNESSIVDINSNSKGLLIPRLTELEKSLIESPANGLLIFNTSINCLQVNSGLPEFPYWRSLSFAGGGTLRLIPELSEIIGEFHMNEPLINCRLKLSFVNNTFNGESMTLDIADISIMGVNGVVVGSIPQMYPWFDPGDTVTFDYNLSGIPQSTGQMTIKFENRGYIYIENVDIIN